MLSSSGRPGKEYGYLKVGQNCVSLPALPLISCVTPSSLCSLSEPLFLYLQDGNLINIYVSHHDWDDAYLRHTYSL